METNLRSILRKERKNADKIYVYYREDSWAAYDCSAYFLSMLYPQIHVVKKKSANFFPVRYVCALVTDDNLLQISEECFAKVDDSCIELDVPAVVRWQKNSFKEWCKELASAERSSDVNFSRRLKQ